MKAYIWLVVTEIFGIDLSFFLDQVVEICSHTWLELWIT